MAGFGCRDHAVATQCGLSTAMGLLQSHLWAKVSQEPHVWMRLTGVGGKHQGTVQAESVTPAAHTCPAPDTFPFALSWDGGRQGHGHSLREEVQKQRTRAVREKCFNKELSEQ